MNEKARRSELVSLKVTPELKVWLCAQARQGYRTVSAEAARILEREMFQAEKENARPAATGQALVTQ